VLAEIAEAHAVAFDRGLAPAGLAEEFDGLGGASRPVSDTMTRQLMYSSRVIHSRTLNLRVSQPAMPTWSGCMWVTKTRVMPRSSGACENNSRQTWALSSVRVPVSTRAQPAPSSSAHRLMWSSA
jgi:hypothetical protein